jgi:hypothetical protein
VPQLAETVERGATTVTLTAPSHPSTAVAEGTTALQNKTIKTKSKKTKKTKKNNNKTNLLSSTDPQSTTTSVGQVKTGASVSTTAFCLNQISGKKNKKQTNKKLLICCAQENPPNGATS